MSPEMIGVAPLQAGIGIFQITPFSVSHSTGRPVSPLTPSRVGPRQWGQSSAAAAIGTSVKTASPERAMKERKRRTATLLDGSRDSKEAGRMPG